MNARAHVRSEIVVLRAVAVICVILFHLKVPGFGGGFVGVDVFFVISGYLITKNILRDIERNKFSFGEFYLRRTRRIYPALICTVLLTYFTAALWCAPPLFLDIAKESTHALLSIANLQYWRESHSYFAANSDQLALLHTWSLSLEEQFYLLWPAIIVAACHTGRVFRAIALISFLSLLGALYVGSMDSSAVFFLPPFRIFEFGCGALVIFLESVFLRVALREVLSGAGFLTILGSAIFFGYNMGSTGLEVCVPCVGAAMVITAGGETKTARMMRRSFLMGLGAISYSLYLCHWPIIFFGRFIFGESANSWAGTLAMGASMLVAAAAMYWFVEQKFRVTTNWSHPWKAIARYAVVVLPLCVLTHVTFASGGFPWRVSASTLAEERLDTRFADTDLLEELQGQPTIALVGDSHAAMYAPGLVPLLKQTHNNVDMVTGAGCPLLYGMQLKSRRRDACVRARDQALKHLSDGDLPVIFVQRWDSYDDASVDYDGSELSLNESGSFTKLEMALLKTLSELSLRHRILLIGAQVPAGCEIDQSRLQQGPLRHTPPPPCPPKPKVEVQKSTFEIDSMLQRVVARLGSEVAMVRPIDYLCKMECPTFYGGHWLYWDRTHFTLAGSNFMVERAEVPLRAFLP